MSKKSSPPNNETTFSGLRGRNIRETERTLRAARRARRQAYAELCAQRKAEIAAGKHALAADTRASLVHAAHLADLPVKREVAIALGLTATDVAGKDGES